MDRRTRAAPAIQTVALVNVPYGGDTNSMRPIGVAFVAAYLEAHGIPAVVYDFSDSLADAVGLVDRFALADHAIVGLSFYNVNATTAYRMARRIKERAPDRVIVAGGPHATASDIAMLERHPEIDIVVRNEGEETLLELVSALAGGRGLSGIAGITYRCTTSTDIERVTDVVREPDRARLRDLDALPPPIATYVSDRPEVPLLFPDDPDPFLRQAGGTRNAVAMVTSRSCPYGCNFCAITMIGRQWRAASPAKVASDFLALDQIAGGRYEHIYFFDANFFVDAARAVRIAESLQSAKPGVTFSFATRSNQIGKARAHLPRLRDLGLRSVEIGIESGSAAALRRFAKDVTPEQNDEALDILRANRIKLGLDFIMFDAECSINDLRANLDFFERNGLDTYVPWESYFTYMTPYLGTEIRSHYERLCGHSFDVDVLPEPAGLILDPLVRQVFVEFHRLCGSVSHLAKAVESIERKCLDLPWSRQAARLAMTAVTLRRFYYCTLSNLVSAASRGSAISLERAMPTFYRDDGDAVSLDELITHSSDSAHRVSVVQISNASAEQKGARPVRDFRDIVPIGIGLAADLGGEKPHWRNFIGAADPDLCFSYLNVAATYDQVRKVQYHVADLVEADFPFVIHPINFNPIDPSDEPDVIVKGTIELALWANARWSAQDVGVWMWHGQYLGEFLMPAIFDETSALAVAEKVRKLNALMPCPFMLENPPVNFSIETMHVLDYMGMVAREADCGLVLDIGHLIGYQIATGRALNDMPLQRFPFDRVVEVHLAGLMRRVSGRYVSLYDHHGYPIDERCWTFLEENIERMPNLCGVTLEQESCDDVLVANHLRRAHRIIRNHRVVSHAAA